MSDIISNILVVRSSAQEQAYIDMVKDGAVKENVVYKERYTVQAKLIALRECISVIFFLVLLWLVVARMSSGAIHITTAILVVTYTTTILTGIYSLSDNLDEHDDVVDKIIPAFEVIDRQNKITDPAKPTTFDSVKGELQFDNVSFAYQEQDGRSDVFKGFSLHVPHGQKLGVVGLSGAGKSTLTKLLLRFDDVDSGKIMIDGIDIRDIKQVDLRRNISYVPQEPMLFHASIRENVLLAKPDASDKEIEAALKAAHAAHFVGALPTGIDSIVGERGVKLSGGQKQRIAIARAVMQDAPIIVLDEATSALDSESEQIIKESFAQILRGKTAIVVAHRLSTLSEMDRIIVIDGGRIAEDGTHASLLRKDGIYANLWRRQQKNADTVEQVVVEPDAVVETAAVATTL
jgi:ATP-binding cassette subfamily B protein